MPTTFKALVYADNKQEDGTYNIKIRVTHNRCTLKSINESMRQLTSFS